MLIIALALVLAPVTGLAGGAMAMTPAAADHHGEMAQDGHCDPGQGQQDDTMADTPCCVALCAAALPAADLLAEVKLLPAPAVPSLTAFGAGFLARLPTPPPRFS